MPLNLTPLSESTETLTSLSEDPGGGFYPGTSAYDAPYPFPSPTSYPGDTYGPTLTPMTED